MSTLILLVVVVTLAYAGACTVAGFGPLNSTLNSFVPEVGPITRQFEQDAVVVMRAYATGAARTPGMHVRQQVDSALLIDLRPTPRILGGSFGMGIRVRVSSRSPSSGVTVDVDAHKKVSFAYSSKDAAALVHAERSLRMNAKSLGLSEILTSPTNNGGGTTDVNR